MSDYDVVVIGTGPGGYVGAIRAAQLGLKVAVVEKRKAHGGTCLNVGCIPSKALLHASEMFEEAGHNFATLGIDIDAPKLNLGNMMAHKQAVIDGNTSGIDYLFKKNKINSYQGMGKIISAGKVSVTADDGSVTELSAKNIIIATGSEVMPLPGVTIDEDKIVSSTGGLELKAVPNKMIVVGGGVIGLELGSVWSRLGAEVTVVEFLDNILPGMDAEVVKNYTRMLKKQGFKFKLGKKVIGTEITETGVNVAVEPAKGGDAEMLTADIVLVAIGRRPFTQGLGLEEAGVKLDARGRVEIDAHFKTNVEGIYAIGDVVVGPMLAHKAEEEGVALAEILVGQAGHVNYDVIPGVVYTMPEIATVGKTEEQLKAEGIAYNVGKFPFSANGRAKAMLKSEGFVKFIADKTTDKVLGCHIVGASAGEMIHEVVLLMEFGGSAEDLARSCHAHPTMSEAVKEAAMAVDNRQIHA
ncbi:MAG: dihydrolipoyl dehydrogenase [Rhizobiales bacterium]|nr:dihydrolipoyl dehydrogenase [Hyphomicrobiales bacterium]NRB14611.1 dihydrolipoyl dehydrogenase [Hyphomicrobiales bacterium]